MHFHFYATYLAARLAGMTQPTAQQLAGYCQGMAEMDIGSQAVLPWYYQGSKFTPCVTGSGVVDDDLGVYHSELAFRRFPAFEAPETSQMFETPETVQQPQQSRKTKASEVPVATVDTVTRRSRQQKPVSAVAIGQSRKQNRNQTQHAYNPLTDIDWKGGGRVKASFGQKVAAKLAGFYRQPTVSEDVSVTVPSQKVPSQKAPSQIVEDRSEPESSPEQITQLDSRLICQPNSAFSRMMLNDSLYKSRYCNKVKGMELALLGCRLFTYQNTWAKSAEQSHIRSQKLVEAFYWTLYAIECFVRSKTMRDKLHLSWQKHAADPALLDNALNTLFSFHGDPLQREFLWLNSLPDILSHYDLKQQDLKQQNLKQKANWWEAFRYRPSHLLEQAMMSCGAGLSRDIKSIKAFRESDFFMLNKAAEYHAQWLSVELRQRRMGCYSTNQSCSDAAAFQL